MDEPFNKKQIAELYNRGADLYRERNLPEALECFQEVLQHDPKFFRAWVFIGMIQFDRGTPKEAISSYERAIELEPNYPKAFNNMGNSLRALGYLDEAYYAFKKAVRLDPGRSLYHYNLGTTCSDIGLHDEASSSLEFALKLDPTLYHVHYDLGTVYYLKEDYARAAEYFEKYLEAAPPDGERIAEVQAKIKGLRKRLQEKPGTSPGDE